MLAQNQSHYARALRLIFGALCLAFYLGGISTWWGALFLGGGAYLLVTGAVGFCPLYWMIEEVRHGHLGAHPH